MTQKLIDAEKAVAVIEAEAKLVQEMYAEPLTCDNPGHCALGALLFAGGMSNAELLGGYGPGEPGEWGDDERATTTGAPHDSASSGGRPKPSYVEG